MSTTKNVFAVTFAFLIVFRIPEGVPDGAVILITMPAAVAENIIILGEAVVLVWSTDIDVLEKLHVSLPSDMKC